MDLAGGCRIRHTLNFNSPRTREAAATLGILFEDCKMRYRPRFIFDRTKAQFISETADRELAELRYRRHRKKVSENIRRVSDLRRELSTESTLSPLP